MPRGDINERVNAKLTREQRSASASKAGKASAEKRRALRSFMELDADTTTDDERLQMLKALKKSAMRGNLKAFEIYRDTMGMKPVDNVNVATIDPNAIAEVEDFLYGAECSEEETAGKTEE